MSAWTCFVCNAPGERPPIVVTLGLFFTEKPAHRRCAEAWYENDQQAILDARAAACAAGHHKYPGKWTKDPADQYGDASYWDCVYGCGFRREHPGYGTGEQIHALGLGPEAVA